MSRPKAQEKGLGKVDGSRTFSHLLRRFALDTKVVLDIGSSEGNYLKHFGKGSLGLTLIDEHIELATGRGLNVIKANIEDPGFSLPQKFEIAWANNLFEHMNAPHLFLMKARELVKPDGLLILGVPVVPWFSFLTRFKKFRGAYAVSHVNFFTRQTLIETVRVGGWTVQEARLFYFKSSMIDALMNPISPHMYIIAHPTPDFAYPNKRLRSLEGYTI